ncbi:potassium channel family protein [Nanoarchaeota archaeon]
MAKFGGMKKLLGLKEESIFSTGYFWVRKHFTPMRAMMLGLLVVLLICMIFFANYEMLPREGFEEKVLGDKSIGAYFYGVYWTITTLTGVGYGDVTPLTNTGRAVAMLVMLCGVLFAGIIISQITSFLVAANLGSMFGIARAKRRMDLIICGWNPTSEATLDELKGGKMEIVLVDQENVSEEAKAANVLFVMGDPTKPEVLQKANIEHARNLVLSLDDDSEALLATHVIRELNPYINLIVKINNHEHVELAKRAGADHVVSPSSIGGRLLSIVADEPHVVEWVVEATTRTKGVTLIEYDIGADSPYVNKTIGAIRKEMGGKAKILGVETAAGFERIPSDDIKIEAGAKLIGIANRNGS